jgi:hypothetical protein
LITDPTCAVALARSSRKTGALSVKVRKSTSYQNVKGLLYCSKRYSLPVF